LRCCQVPNDRSLSETGESLLTCLQRGRERESSS
jgi:hypothetical protein